MRPLLITLVALVLMTGAALAQTTTTVIPVTTIDYTTTAVCPTPLPGLCAAVAQPNVTGDTVVMVLGYEEHYALENLPARHLGWRAAASNYSSIFAQGNPLTYYQPNALVTRHGNPYFPYYQVPGQRAARLATTSVAGIPASVSPDARAILESVNDRYRRLTPQQVMAMGYQPVGACTVGMGQIYINRALVDNVFDPYQPEAFTFAANGKLLSAQYIIVSAQPILLYGQQTRPSAIVAGAQQLPVWLFSRNSNGLFADVNPRASCT